MSAAIDRMAQEAMVRVQAHIAAEADYHRAAIHWQAGLLRVHAQARYLGAVKEQRLRRFHPTLLMLKSWITPAQDIQRYEEAEQLRNTTQILATEARRRNLPRVIYEEDDPLPFGVLFFGGIALALTLGWLGPAIDALPDRRAEWLATERTLQVEGTLRSWEEEARISCAAMTGENGGVILVNGGAIYCTDKHGRKVGRPL